MVQKCGYQPLVVDSGDAAVALLTPPMRSRSMPWFSIS